MGMKLSALVLPLRHPGRRGRRNKNPARNPGRAHVAIFNFRHYADLAAAVKLAGRARRGAHSLWLSPAPCQDAAMRRIDRYDIIGMVLLALVVALWVLHFSLPTPPPDNYRNLGSAVPAAEPGAIRRG
jgi:hypothetical protein